MFRFKTLTLLLLLSLNLFSETKYKFRGFIESKGIGKISIDSSNPLSIDRDLNQGFSILSNQYIKIVPEKGMSIVASINQTFLSGITSKEYDEKMLYSMDDSYILGLDIERLFFSYRRDRFKTSFGIQRLSRGFNFAFTPFDFININNVTTSNSPQGKLSLITEFETSDFSNLSLYFIPSENPLEKEIWSSTTGILFKSYGGFIDFQIQYNLLFPKEHDGDYNHLFGIAFKGDLVVGYASEITYNLNADDIKLHEDGLDISIGIDYSFDFEKELALRFEYYFNGAGLDSDKNWDLQTTKQYPFKHNIYASLDQTITDDLNIKLSGIISPISSSGIAMLDLGYRVSDSSSLALSINAPMDRTAWDINNVEIEDIGQYGPIRVGEELSITLAYKIKY